MPPEPQLQFEVLVVHQVAWAGTAMARAPALMARAANLVFMVLPPYGKNLRCRE